MRSFTTYVAVLLERLVAAAALFMILPGLLLVALVLRMNSDEAILLTDNVRTGDGMLLRSYRFRTTGRGTPAFRTFGRFLRALSFDELPGLLAVARGWIPLGHMLSLTRGTRAPPD
jgi:lipopolysaccharide/colanic/teichoic acid biosynthesis glycosyltransferase